MNEKTELITELTERLAAFEIEMPEIERLTVAQLQAMITGLDGVVASERGRVLRCSNDKSDAGVPLWAIVFLGQTKYDGQALIGYRLRGRTITRADFLAFTQAEIAEVCDSGLTVIEGEGCEGDES